MAFDNTGENKPFADQNELLDCFTDILDIHIFYLYRYHSWVGPDNHLQSMMGVVVSREEFESNLLHAASSVCFSKLTETERAELDALRSFFIERFTETERRSIPLPVVKLVDTFGLNSFQLFAVLTLLCCELEQKYEKLFAYIQDDIAKKRPTAETLIRLFGEPLERLSNYFGYFSDNSELTRYFFTSEGTGLGGAVLRLSPQILHFLTENGKTDSCYEYWTPDEGLHSLYSDKDIAQRLLNAVRQPVAGKTSLAVLSGKRGSGRRFQVRHCAAALGEDVIFADIRSLCTDDEMESRINGAVCTRVLKNCALCFTGFEYLLEEENSGKLLHCSELLTKSRKWLGDRLYITSDKAWQDARLGGDIVKLDFELPETSEGARLALWEAFMSGKTFENGIDPQEMAAKFHFTPGQIHAAVQRAADITEMSGEKVISAAVLHDSCYAQVVVGLNTLATPIKPAYDWDDLVLPQQEIKLLKEACTHVKYRHQVYGEWGFGKKAAYGRGLSVLFSGPPGTGKTMAAQVITNQLHMKMYKVQISQIVSKYIGETEKNLRQVFTEAKEANCILFFDEMDALFGKRSEVKDSHDRNANIETAYLLQQLEEYDGVILMATNLLQNIDEAFMRRINFVVSFPFPDVPTRKQLWKKMLETKAPIDDSVDFDFLAENFKIAGGNIKNCAIHAAFLAAAESSPITMKHLISSVVNEQRKNNVVVLKEDLKEYGDLFFGE